jgi:hypothetical protein
MRRFEVTLATAAAFGVAALFWWSAANPGTVRSPDASDYAQMGRELARGHGFATRQIFPRHVPFLAERNLLEGDRWPNLYRYPVQPILEAVAQTFVSDVRMASSFVSGVSFALGVALLFWLGVRLAGVAGGAGAGALYAVDPAVYQSAHLGLTEPTASALLLVVCSLALACREISPLRSAALGGAAGLAVLTRTQVAFLLPLVLAWAVWRSEPRRRAVAAAACLAAFAIALSPWLVRNAALVGAPAFSFSSTRSLVLGTTGAYTDLDMQLHEPVHLTDVVARHGGAIAEKVIHENLPMALSAEFWADMFRGVPPAVAFLALLAFPLAFRRGVGYPRSLPWLMLGVLTLNFVSVSLAHHELRFYLIVRPCLYLLAGVTLGEFVREVAERTSAPRRARLAGSVAILCVAALLVARGRLFERVSARPQPAALALLAELTPPSALVVSDISYRIALDEDRRTLRLPDHPSDLLEIDDCYLTVDALVLSERVLRDWSNSRRFFANYSEYRRFVSTPEFADRFTEAGRLPGGATLFLHSDAAGRPASDCPTAGQGPR